MVHRPKGAQAPKTYYTFADTPVGPFLLAGDGQALSMSSFTTGKQRREPQAAWIRDRAPLREADEQLQQYFSGERLRFDFPLNLHGTAFQTEVWIELQNIPAGETRTYGELAALVGRPRASRAVGSANAANYLPLIIPCHRLVGANGHLTGFGGGLETKQWLLRFEGAL